MRPNKRENQNKYTGLVVSLPTELVVKDIPSVKIKSSSLEVISIQDIPSMKKIIAKTKELGDVVLWESDSYDRVGQWTDSDVETRLIELFLK